MTPIITRAEHIESKQSQRQQEKVSLNNSLLKMATGDTELIHEMKNRIQYLQSVMVQREKLLFAITNNVHYLQSTHKKNQKQFEKNKKETQKALAENEQLKEENAALTKERNSLKKCKNEYEEAQEEIAQFVIEQQANAEEIKNLYEQNQSKQDQFEKIKLEVTVVMAEKVTFQRELEKAEANHSRMKRDFKDLKAQFDLRIDEIVKLQQ